MMYESHCLRCGQHHFYETAFLSLGAGVPHPSCGRVPITCPTCRASAQPVVGRRFLEWARTNPNPCIEALVPA